MCINLLNLVVPSLWSFVCGKTQPTWFFSSPLWRGQSDYRAEMSLKHVWVIMEQFYLLVSIYFNGI